MEGLDGSGRSTQIALLQEWLESEGFAVQTSGLRRSNLVGRDIDELLAKNAVTRLTLALMYATDFFDQLEHRIVPALRSGTVVLADRFIFTLIARSVVRGINRDYLTGLYAMALRPHLTFWLNVRPENRVRARVQEGPGHQLLGSRPRHVALARPLLVLCALPDHDQARIRGYGQEETRSSSSMANPSVSSVNKQLRQRIGRTSRHPRLQIHSFLGPSRISGAKDDHA